MPGTDRPIPPEAVTIAEQFEFPLVQGEFGFAADPLLAGLTGPLGAFAWFAVLRIWTVETAPSPPFSVSIPSRRRR